MNVRIAAAGLVAAMGLTWAAVGFARADDEEVPTPFGRFEAMIGAWKGTARPAANKVRGWQETHSWAYKFVAGKPAGITFAIEGGKVISRGEIRFDGATGKYTLVAKDVAGKPVSFVGGPWAEGKPMVFDRVEAGPDGKERLTIRPTSNNIRYTMLVDLQAPGSPQYKNSIEVGLTKEGESFAAGAGGADMPKCIITGGTATMTVSFEGRSFPICCTGCRDEFNDNPQKYLARAQAKANAEPEKPAAKVEAPKPKADDGIDSATMVDTPKPTTSSSSKPSAAPAKADDRATRDLRLGQAFEKGGKTKQALEYYRGVVKKYPGTEAATTAEARIKALATP